MQELPVDHQIAIELHYWEGMRVREVAEVLGVPAGTVKGRLMRARTALAKALADHEFDIAGLDPKSGGSGVPVG